MASNPKYLRGIANTSTRTLAATLAAAVAEFGDAASGMLQALGDSITEGLFSADFRDIHQNIGELAQAAVVESYAGRPHKGPATGYRRGVGGKNQRYAGGALLRALSAPDFFRATSAGLNFGNVAVLNKEARHWHRIAFGAAPAGGGAHSSYTVTWGSLVVAALGLDEPASRPFTIPRGYFVGPGTTNVQGRGAPGSGEFYPSSGRKPGISGRPTIARRIPTAGIVGYDFFSPGLRVIAEELPVGYARVYNRVYNDAAKRAQATLRGVRIVRPARQNFSVG